MINESLKIVWMKINGNTTVLLHVYLHLERDVCCIQDSRDERLLAGSTALTDKILLPREWLAMSMLHRPFWKKRHILAFYLRVPTRKVVYSVELETTWLIFLQTRQQEQGI